MNFPLNTVQIGLLSMLIDYQGSGLVLKFIQSVINTLYSNLISNIFVVTQGLNYASHRIYRKIDFLTKKIKL